MHSVAERGLEDLEKHGASIVMEKAKDVTRAVNKSKDFIGEALERVARRPRWPGQGYVLRCFARGNPNCKN